MKWLLIVTTSLLLAVLATTAVAKPTRTVELSETDIGQVNASVGYSTIIQFDARPTSAVLGDQDAFKVEYVGNSLTIKPLIPGARTNLFVFTDYERFSFRLVTGASSQVDYVVAVKRKRSKSTSSFYDDASYGEDVASEKMTTITVNRTASCRSTSLLVESYSYPKAKPWVVVHFAVSQGAKGKNGFEFKPESLVLVKGKELVPIETIYLETAGIPANDTKVKGSLLVHKENPKSSSQLSLVFAPEHFNANRCAPLKVRLQPKK
jgi:hypothetical protein